MIILNSTLADADLARLLNVNRKTVGDWRCGRNAPATTRATAVAHLDLIARTGAPAPVITLAGHRVAVATDAASITTVTVDGHSVSGWCGSGVCLLRLVSEAIRLAEREGVAP